jgi:hypothetical protein
MRFRFFLFLFFSLVIFNSSNANESFELNIEDYQVIVEYNENNFASNDSTITSSVKFKRGKALLFTIFTGFLGGHRIYLGTHHRTPILYSVTLGGLGILPLVDLIHIIFTKDLSIFEYRSQIIMWGK